jgi:hypothetical protein
METLVDEIAVSLCELPFKRPPGLEPNQAESSPLEPLRDINECRLLFVERERMKFGFDATDVLEKCAASLEHRLF